MGHQRPEELLDVEAGLDAYQLARMSATSIMGWQGEHLLQVSISMHAAELAALSPDSPRWGMQVWIYKECMQQSLLQFQQIAVRLGSAGVDLQGERAVSIS